MWRRARRSGQSRQLAQAQPLPSRIPRRGGDRRSDGIVVRGAKAHTSVSTNANELIVIPTRALAEADRDYAVSFAIPIDTPGLVLLASAYDSSSPQEAPQETVAISSENAKPASAPPATAETGSLAPEFSLERLHDYVAAFVLAGLDRNVGAEVEFYADRVEYYDSGTMDREKIRLDLKRYDEQWPERHFWIAGKITIEPQGDNRLRVTFPLGFKLRNGNRIASGKVDKTLVLEKTGDDLQIVAVNERKAERK